MKLSLQVMAACSHKDISLDCAMELLTCGQKLNIQRSDGRIHPVVITRLNHNSQMLTVEWSERKNAKGKEVALKNIMSLNPEIFNPQIVDNESQSANVLYGVNDCSFGSKESGKALPATPTCASKLTAETTTNATPRLKGDVIEQISKIPILHGQRQSLDGTNTAGMSILYRLSAGLTPPRTSSNNTRELPAADASRFCAGNIKNRKTASATKERRVSTPNAHNRSNPKTSSVIGSGDKLSHTGKRSSAVVRTVQNMRDNREKRRARHAELRQQKEDLKNQDPDNPNWEVAHMVHEYQKTIEFKPLHSIGQMVNENQQITVCVRKRPLSRKERARKEIDVISVPRKNALIVHELRHKVDLTKFLEHHNFRFDYAFDDQCSNELIYEYAAKPLVRTIFEGGRATCFAYGQTGSGKTHTMGGEFNGKTQNCTNGIYALAAHDVFSQLKQPPFNKLNLNVSCSFFEIYGSKVFDLLTEQKRLLRVLEDGRQQVQVVGLTEQLVHSVPEVLKLIERGNNERFSGQTSANAKSSRSHAVFQIVLRKNVSLHVHGKFSFIDLAGNERGADTSSATRQTRMEGADINKSLLALKECIRALGRQKAHLPFRVSKLTQVLRDSFIGGEKSRTCMIAMISPGLNSCEHTLNTLRYADRVKELVAKDSDAPDTPDNLSATDPHSARQREQRKEHAPIDTHNYSDHHDDDDDDDDEQKNSKIESPQAERENDAFNASNNNNNNSSNSMSLSWNENDLSDEAAAMHVIAINDIQRTEERVIEQHFAANDCLEKFIEEYYALINNENGFDYDRGWELFNALAGVATNTEQLMKKLQEKLEIEELLSGAFPPPSDGQ